jgi:hypothetical protein
MLSLFASLYLLYCSPVDEKRILEFRYKRSELDSSFLSSDSMSK